METRGKKIFSGIIVYKYDISLFFLSKLQTIDRRTRCNATLSGGIVLALNCKKGLDLPHELLNGPDKAVGELLSFTGLHVFGHCIAITRGMSHGLHF